MDTWYERLSTLDSLFLEIEDRSAHMHVGAVAIFEGPPPPYRDFLALIELVARHETAPQGRSCHAEMHRRGGLAALAEIDSLPAGARLRAGRRHRPRHVRGTLDAGGCDPLGRDT